MTTDPAVLDSVLRLAAVADVEVEVDAEGRGAWSTAPIVLIGADAAAALASMHLPRRPGVIVVGVGAPAPPPGAGPVASTGSPAPDGIWRDALALGAEHVIVLPDAEAWLIQRLGEAADGPSRAGRLAAVLSASGGVGVSTLAASLALAASGTAMRTMLIDGGPDGGGLDLVLGAESAPGIRWPELGEARGRLSASTLDLALPHPHGVALLSHARPRGAHPDHEVARSVLDAARRGYDLAIVDLADHGSPFADAVLDTASHVVVVVAASVRGIAAGLGLLDTLRGRSAHITIVLRALPRGVGARDAIAALGRGDVLVIPDAPALAQRADRGDPTLPRDAFGRGVHAVLDAISPARARAA